MSDQETRQIAETVIERIHLVLQGPSFDQVEVQVTNACVVLQGVVPDAEAKSNLIDCVRQAGVLWRVDNQIQIAA
ncbi:MAG: BON domain-containing protein [Planctomycetota bacterium]